MQEKLKIFSDDKINKLETDVNAFILNPDIVPIDVKYDVVMDGNKMNHSIMLRYQDWTGEVITPKKKNDYKWKRSIK